MPRDLDAVVAEALDLAAQRGGLLSHVTLAVPFPSSVMVDRVRRHLARAGVSDVEVVLEESEGPVRILAVEVQRRR